MTNSADNGPGTLRDRIAAANANDKINIQVKSPILLNSELVIGKNLRIDNFSGPAFKLSGNNQTRIFNVTAGSLELHDLTLADGRALGTNGAAGMGGETVYGGAIQVASGASLSLDKCVFSNNVAQGGQGGLQGQFGSAGNGGNGFGGAIGSFGTLTLVRSVFVENSAIGGAGGLATTGTPGSGGQGWGGAVFSSGEATISRSTLYLNHAVAGTGDAGPGGAAGGAIYNQYNMILMVSTVASNTASGSAFDFGGGVHHGGASLAVRDCTIVGNQAAYGGGVTGGDFINTIIAGNTALNGPDGSGVINSIGFNLIQTTNGMTLTGNLAHCIVGQDPMLGLLKDNGSLDTEFTPPNMMPLPGSPVIDRGGSYYNFDQRLFTRPFDTDLPNTGNGSDIGAVEIQATTLVVENANDSGPGSLRQAILDNNGLGGGNIIVFAANVTGTIQLSGSGLVISAPVSIAGPGPEVLAVSGNNSVRVFSVLAGPSQITGLTICNGLDVGGTGGQGQNGGDGRGGGIYMQEALSLENCTIRSNRVIGGVGGELHLGSVGKGGRGLGGAIYNANAYLNLEFCSFEANAAIGGQGGAGPGGAAGGGGNGIGGAVDTGGDQVTVQSCRFTGNVAEGGAGGIGSEPGMGGQGYGGAFFNESSTWALYVTFSESRAKGGIGGGGNGSGYGGAIYNQGSFEALVCTIASNSVAGSSTDFGGGIYNVGTLKLINLTIAGNSADYGGGLHGNADLYSSIIAGNTATTLGSDVSGTINSYDYNLIQSLNGMNITGLTAHMIFGQDPMLGPLADNGGFGRTMALRPGSPAIDKGKNFAYNSDQRTAWRPFDFGNVSNAGEGDGSDIGAYELGQPRLSLLRNPGGVVAHWPAGYADFVLESSPTVSGTGIWTTVAATPVIGPGARLYVTNSPATGDRFFRLRSR